MRPVVFRNSIPAHLPVRQNLSHADRGSAIAAGVHPLTANSHDVISPLLPGGHGARRTCAAVPRSGSELGEVGAGEISCRKLQPYAYLTGPGVFGRVPPLVEQRAQTSAGGVAGSDERFRGECPLSWRIVRIGRAAARSPRQTELVPSLPDGRAAAVSAACPATEPARSRE